MNFNTFWSWEYSNNQIKKKLEYIPKALKEFFNKDTGKLDIKAAENAEEFGTIQKFAQELFHKNYKKKFYTHIQVLFKSEIRDLLHAFNIPTYTTKDVDSLKQFFNEIYVWDVNFQKKYIEHIASDVIITLQALHSFDKENHIRDTDRKKIQEQVSYLWDHWLDWLHNQELTNAYKKAKNTLTVSPDTKKKNKKSSKKKIQENTSYALFPTLKEESSILDDVWDTRNGSVADSNNIDSLITKLEQFTKDLANTNYVGNKWDYIQRSWYIVPKIHSSISDQEKRILLWKLYWSYVYRRNHPHVIYNELDRYNRIMHKYLFNISHYRNINSRTISDINTSSVKGTTASNLHKLITEKDTLKNILNITNDNITLSWQDQNTCSFSIKLTNPKDPNRSSYEYTIQSMWDGKLSIFIVNTDTGEFRDIPSVQTTEIFSKDPLNLLKDIIHIKS